MVTAAGSGSSLRGGLPVEVGSFVGRERQLTELAEIFPRERLLTLTGSGGSGKTRLALRFASGLIPHFADGIHFVELAPLSDL